MSLNDITNKIKLDAQEKVKSIISGAKKKVEVIEHESQNAMTDFENTFLSETKAVLEKNERTVKATAEQETKLNLAKEKRELLNSVFEAAQTQLMELSDSDYSDLLEKIVKKYLPAQLKGMVLCPKKRFQVTKQVLEKTDFVGEYDSSNKIKTGFIILGDDFEYDFTFERLIQDKRGELEIEVAGMLFGD